MRRASSPTLLPTCPRPRSACGCAPQSPIPDHVPTAPARRKTRWKLPTGWLARTGKPGRPSRPVQTPRPHESGAFRAPESIHSTAKPSRMRAEPRCPSGVRRFPAPIKTTPALTAPPNSTHSAPVNAGPGSHQRAFIRQQSPHACGQSRDDRAAGAGLPTLPQKQLDLSRPIKTKHPALPAPPP